MDTTNQINLDTTVHLFGPYAYRPDNDNAFRRIPSAFPEWPAYWENKKKEKMKNQVRRPPLREPKKPKIVFNPKLGKTIRFRRPNRLRVAFNLKADRRREAKAALKEHIKQVLWDQEHPMTFAPFIIHKLENDLPDPDPNMDPRNFEIYQADDNTFKDYIVNGQFYRDEKKHIRCRFCGMFQEHKSQLQAHARLCHLFEEYFDFDQFLDLVDPPQEQQMQPSSVSSLSNEGQIGLVSDGLQESTDSTTFVDPSVGQIDVIPETRATKMELSVNVPTTIDQKLDRKTIINSGAMASYKTNDQIFLLEMPHALFKSKGYVASNIVRMHEYFSCDRLRFTVQIPAETPLTGQFQLFWLPGLRKGSSPQNILFDNMVDTYSQIMDVSNENTIVLEVPVTAAINSLVIGSVNDVNAFYKGTNADLRDETRFQGYGMVGMRVFNTITGITDVDVLTYVLYVEPVGSQVQFQTLGKPLTYDRVEAFDEQQGGVIALGAALGTAMTAGAVNAAPAFGAAVAGSLVSAAVGSIVKVGKNCTVYKQIANDLGTMNASIAHDERAGIVVGYRTADCNVTNQEVTNTVQEVQDVTSKRSRIAVIEWKTASATGANLVSSLDVDPTMGSKFGTGDKLGNEIDMTNMGYLSQFFNFYRGSIDIMVEVVGNAYTRGTLALIVAPPTAKTLAGMDPIENFGNFAVTYFNVQDVRRMTINVPYNSKTQWNRVKRFNNLITPAGWVGGGILGKFYLAVISPLRTQTISGDSSIFVNIYVSSRDMEFYHPIERSNISPVRYWIAPDAVDEEQGTSDKMVAHVDIMGPVKPLPQPSFNNQDHSDLLALASIRSIYEIFELPYEYTKINIPLPFAYFKKYDENTTGRYFTTEFSFLSMVMQMFTWYQGSVSLTIMNLEPTNQILSFVARAEYIRLDEFPRVMVKTQSSRFEFGEIAASDNCVVHNFSLNQIQTFSFPWYNEHNCLPANLVYFPNEPGAAEGDGTRPTMYSYCNVTLIFRRRPGNISAGSIMLAESAGPGFALNQFIGAPRVWTAEKSAIQEAEKEQLEVEEQREMQKTKKKKKVRFCLFTKKSKKVDDVDGLEVIDESDESDEPEDQQMFASGLLGSDVSGKLVDTLTKMTDRSEISLGLMDKNLKKGNEVFDKFGDLTDKATHLTDRINDDVIDKTSTILDDVSATGKKFTETITKLNSRVDRVFDQIEKILNPPSSSKRSITGKLGADLEKQILRIILQCAHEKEITPMIDEILCRLYDWMCEKIPKNSNTMNWIIRAIKAGACYSLRGMRISYVIEADILHDGISTIFGDDVQEQEGPNTQDESFLKQVGIIISAILTGITMYYVKMTKLETVSLFAKMRDIFGVFSGMLTVSRFLEMMIQALKYLYEKFFPSEDIKNDIDWYLAHENEVSEMIIVAIKIKEMSAVEMEDDDVIVGDVCRLVAFAKEFIVRMTKVSKSESNYVKFIQYAESIVKTNAYLKQSTLSRNRPVPVPLLFYGASQIGKTHLLTEGIPFVLGKIMKRKMTTYEKNPASKFWDRYNFQSIVMFDDIGSLVDQTDLQDMLLIFGNNPLPLNMGEVTEKGMMFRSPFVFMSTNRRKIDSNRYFTNPEAIDNRLYKNAYEVVLNPQYATEGKFDPKKCKGLSPDKIYTFYRMRIDYNAMNGSVVTQEKVSFGALLDDLCRRYFDNKQAADEMKARAETGHETSGTGMDFSNYYQDSDDEQDQEMGQFDHAPGEHDAGASNTYSDRTRQKEATNRARRFQLAERTLLRLFRDSNDGHITFDSYRELKSGQIGDRTSLYNRKDIMSKVITLLSDPLSSSNLEQVRKDDWINLSWYTGSYPSKRFEAEANITWITNWYKAIETEIPFIEKVYQKTSWFRYIKGGFDHYIRPIFERISHFSHWYGSFGQDYGMLIYLIINYLRTLLAVWALTLTWDSLSYLHGTIQKVFGYEMSPAKGFISPFGPTFKGHHLKRVAEQDRELHGEVQPNTAAWIKSYKHNYTKSGYTILDDEPQGRNYDGNVRDATARKKQPRKVVYMKAAQEQHGQTMLSDVIIDNVCFLENRKSNYKLRGIMVKDDILLTVGHFFENSEEGDNCRLTFANKTIDFIYREDRLLQIGVTDENGETKDHDVAFYRIGYEASSFKDISKHFVKEEDIDRIDGQPGYRLEIEPYKITTVPAWKIKDTRVRIRSTGEIIRVPDRLYSYVSGDFGMCGLPLIVENTVYFGSIGKIAGIHAFGQVGTSGGGYVTINMIKDACEHLKGSPSRVDPKEDDVQNQHFFENRQDFPYYTNVRKATAKEINLEFGKSKIQRSPLFGIFEPTHDRASLSRFDRRLDDPDNFDLELISKTNKPSVINIPMTKATRKKMMDKFMEMWESCRHIAGSRTFTVQESVNGFDAGPLEQWTKDLGLVMNKSAGPIYNKQGKHKFPFFTCEEDETGRKTYTPLPLLAERIKERIDMAKNLQVPDDSYCGDSVKDELRKIAKVKSGGSRIINFFQLDYIIVFGMYFGAFRAMFTDPKNAGPKLFSALACDPKTLWPLIGPEIRDAMFHFGIDYTAYDSSIPATIHEFMIECINNWYKFHGDTEENCKIRYVLWWECIHTKHIYLDTVYEDHHGLPSGVPCGMTTISNICVNTIIFMLTFIRLGVPLSLLGTTVKPMFMGDDNLVWNKFSDNETINKLTSKIDRIAVAETAALLGMKATMPDKSPDLTPSDSFEELTFLKSYFRDEVIPGWYLPAMEKQTIQNLLTFYRPKGQGLDINQFKENISNALEFAVPWGKEYYDSLTALLKRNEKINDLFSESEIAELFPPHDFKFMEIYSNDSIENELV